MPTQRLAMGTLDVYFMQQSEDCVLTCGAESAVVLVG
jgi:hypothetical protein